MLSTVQNCRAITKEIRKVLPNRMSNYLPTEYKLDQLRAAVKSFIIDGEKGPLWRTKEHTPEEHSALIKKACANTEFETKQEQKSNGRRKIAKTEDTKLQARRVTNKVRELKNIPIYGAKRTVDFQKLLEDQRKRH